jgi:23S rRNA-/tRNA-specific pseudouridylate synthase
VLADFIMMVVWLLFDLPPFLLLTGHLAPVCHCLLQYLLKHQLGGQWLYPVHRLDRATSGVVLYCLSTEAASQLSRSLREREVKKVGRDLILETPP